MNDMDDNGRTFMNIEFLAFRVYPSIYLLTHPTERTVIVEQNFHRSTRSFLRMLRKSKRLKSTTSIRPNKNITCHD